MQWGNLHTAGSSTWTNVGEGPDFGKKISVLLRYVLLVKSPVFQL
jgi:hypothetical protein